MRFTTARLAYNHGNRLGYLGYGVKPGQAVVGPSDTRAFRDIKLGEVAGWVRGRPVDLPYAFMAVRRYWKAFLFKYSRPGMHPASLFGSQTVGGPGMNHNFLLSGSGWAMIFVAFFTFFQLVIFKDENHHHQKVKYHTYPVSESIMSLVPGFTQKGRLEGDFESSGVIKTILAAGFFGISAAGVAANPQLGGAALLAAIYYFTSIAPHQQVPLLLEDRAYLAELLGADGSTVDALVAKNNAMGEKFNYSKLGALLDLVPKL